jgi:hypothetical protein
VDGVGGPVVLVGLPHERISVVLAVVVDSDADAEGEGGLALGDVAVADAVGGVGGHAEGGIRPVEGLLSGPLGRPVVVVVDPVAVIEVGVQVRTLGAGLSGRPWSPSHRGLLALIRLEPLRDAYTEHPSYLAGGMAAGREMIVMRRRITALLNAGRSPGLQP